VRALPDGLLQLLTRRMQLLSDPVRVRILTILEQGEACVQELTDELGATHQNVSHHLGLLYREGVLSRRKEGTTVFYALADYTTCRLLEQALASVCGQVEELGEIVSAAAATASS
jgi:DNA-binding transcriptional ArsR family regulator